MCCFSRSVPFVGATRIFARGLPDGLQWLAYAMNVEIEEELAMVLPLPVPPGPAEDAVSFLDLSDYEGFFGDLARAFPPTSLAQAASRGFAPAPAPRTLEVHDVGMFEASFVPTRADFARLDERFRLPESTFAAMPRYDDYGFAVFRLKPKRGLLGRVKRQSVHPMAFSFPRRSPRSLFFPTVHVHDGTAPEYAVFDHQLYCQLDGVLAATVEWTPSESPLGAKVDARRARGLIDASAGGFVQPLFGALANDDTWLHEPAGVTVEELSGAGECYSFAIRAGWAHRATGAGADERGRAWHHTSAQRLGTLSRGLAAGLASLCAARREAWGLTTLRADLPAHFMNGPQLWRGEDWRTGTRELASGPGRVKLTPFTERVEPQAITLGFSRLPDERLVAEIQAELRLLLDRALDGGVEA